jgi:hypothetical protein
MKVTRRKLARILAATSMATAAVPATIIPAEAQAQPSAASDEETQSAHNQLHNNAQQLAGVKFAMATEPAFHFKA